MYRGVDRPPLEEILRCAAERLCDPAGKQVQVVLTAIWAPGDQLAKTKFCIRVRPKTRQVLSTFDGKYVREGRQGTHTDTADGRRAPCVAHT